MAVMRSGSATAIGVSRTASRRLKIAALAPMPSPSDRIAARAKPGARTRKRAPYFRSPRNVSIHSRSSPFLPFLPLLPSLLVSQRLGGVDPQRTTRRDVAGGNPDEDEQRDRTRERRRVERSDAHQQGRDQLARKGRQRYADGRTDER